MSSGAQKRLLKDLKELHEKLLEFASVAPRDGDIMTWDGFILGPEGTIFEDGVFEILIEFGEDYPITAPIVTFISEISHPNVMDNGKLAQEAIESFWLPTYEVWSLLLKLQLLLREPVEGIVYGRNSDIKSEIDYHADENEINFHKSRKEALGVVEQDLKGMATSNAPAGGTYRDVEHAGQCTLQDNAHDYPETEKSTMIPPKFVSKYPEPIEESTGEIVKANRTLTKREENRFTGLTRNACGEEAEYAVFKAFEKLVHVKNDPPILVMRNYVLQNFKANVLALELGMNFDGIHTVAEFDAVVAIKDTGLVLVEVKRQYTQDQQAKAEEQLENGKLFFERIMCNIITSGSHLPIMKMIVFPEEGSTSPTSKSDCDTQILYKDMLLNFNQKWKELTTELESLNSSTTLTSDDFRRFSRIITGIWCMQKYQKRFYQFDSNEASSLHQLQQIDNMVNRAILTSDARDAKDESKIVQPISNVELCRPQDGSSTNVEADLIYLTPEQKNLYQNVSQAIIRAPAGAGKTLLSNLKIVDILRNHPDKNILIVAPDPHHLRMEQIVRANGGQPTVIKSFPPPVSNGVFIITLRDFFDVKPETLQSYDISMFHVFIDDLQSLYLFNSTFDDIADVIDRSFTSVVGTDRTLWCAVDVGQSPVIGTNNITYVPYLFNINETTTPRHFKIPIYTLNKILRNSVEIATVVQKVRKLRVDDRKASSRVLTNNTIGHRIRCETVTYHTVTNWTSTGDDWKMVGKEFALERIKEEVSSLVTSKNTTMKLSDIAIIYDFYYSDDFNDLIRSMLVNTFNITTQTISEHIKTNNTNAIIFNFVDKVASFECACVLYLCCYSRPGNSDHYNAMTRARTELVVVDMSRHPPLLTDNVILIKWKEKDGTFYKL